MSGGPEAPAGTAADATGDPIAALREEIVRLARAGCGLIVAETHEEERVVRAASEAAGAAVRVWSPARGFGEEVVDALDALRRARLEPEHGLYLWLDLAPVLDRPEVARALRELAAAAGKTSLVVGAAVSLPPVLARAAVRLAVPLPGEAERLELARAIAGGEDAGADDAAALARAVAGLTRREAETALRLGAGRAPGARVAEAIAFRRERLAAGGVLGAVPGEIAPADIGGLGHLKAWLATRARALTPEGRAFGLPDPRGVLILGVQGCGKSLAARACGAALGAPVWRLDLAAVLAHRRPEAALSGALASVEALAPAVLWMDEIDKGWTGEALAARAPALLARLLSWMQERTAPVFVAATANEADRLPPELARRGRFDDVFFVDLPDAHDRAEVFLIHLGRAGRDPAAFDLPALAARSDRLSGAEIAEVVRGALHRAFAAGRDLSQQDLLDEAAATVPLSRTFEERIEELRRWSRGRARPAALDRRSLAAFRAG